MMTIFRFCLFSLFCLFSFSPAVYAASSTHQADALYAFGNVETLYAVFNGVAAIVKSGTFKNLSEAMLLIGCGITLLSTFRTMGSGVERLALWGLGVSVFGLFMTGVTSNVMIIDQVNSDKTYVVEDLPFVIAKPAVWLSEIGFDVAALIDEGYSSVSNVPVSLTLTGGSNRQAIGAPMNIAAQMLYDASRYQITDPFLKDSLTHFVADCLVPEIANNTLSTDQLLSSADLWGLVKNINVNPAIMTLYYGTLLSPVGGNGEVLTCQDAESHLTNDLTDAESNAMNEFATHWGSNVTTSVASELFSSVFNYVTANTSYSTSPGQTLGQATLLNLFQGPLQRLMANQSNSSLLMNELGVVKAERETTSNWMTTALVFSDTFGYVYAILQVLIFGLAPVALLMAFIPNFGLRSYVKYLQLVAWFPVSMVLLSIANAILTQLTQGHLNPYWTQNGYQGLSLNTQALVCASSSKMIEVGAWLSAVVPMMAWGLVTRSDFGMTQVFSHLGLRQYAAQAAATSVDGNVAFDTQRYDDLSAHQHNMDYSTSMGERPVMDYSAGSNINQVSDYGGVALKQNLNPLAKHIQTVEQTQTLTSQSHDATLGQSQSLSSTDALKHEAQVSQQSVNMITDSIKTSYQGGAFTAAATLGTQAYLAHHNFHLNDADQAHAAKLSSQAALYTSEAAQADSQGHYQEAQGLTEKAAHVLQAGHDWLTEKMGGSETASKAAWGVMAAGAGSALVGGVALGGSELAAGAVEGVGVGARVLGGYFSKLFEGVAGQEAASAEKAFKTAAEWQAENNSAYTDYVASDGETLNESEFGAQAEANAGRAGVSEKATPSLLKRFADGLNQGLSGSIDVDTAGSYRIEAKKQLSSSHDDQASDKTSHSEQQSLKTQHATTTTQTTTSSATYPDYDLLKRTDEKSVGEQSGTSLSNQSLQEKINAFKQKTAAIRQSIGDNSDYRGGIELKQLKVPKNEKELLSE